MEEIWKDIDGYDGLYQVSNLGNVRTIYDNNKHKEVNRILRPALNKNGYKRVNLNKMYNRKNFSIHRLVAKAFIPNPDNLPCVNHRDECKTNNCVENLEWCTIAYNNAYGTHKDCNKREVCMMQNDVLIKKFNSVSEASQYLNVDPTTISKVLHKKIKSWHGFTFT